MGLPMYSFTIKKYLRSKSTWIITAISTIFIAFLFGTALPFGIMSSSVSSPEYAAAVQTWVGVAGGFMAIFSAVFAGFKAATMYKDEVEEGTFLMVLSKPVRRSSIIFQKWFALFTIIVIYTFITVVGYVIGVEVFDKGARLDSPLAPGYDTLRSKIGLVAVYLFLILLVVGLIFGSIGVLVSTRLSTGSTIGISIALGIAIPITSIIGTVLKKPEYQSLSNSQFAITKAISDTTGITSPEIDALAKTIDEHRVYDWALATGSNDLFKWGWVVDLQYQIRNMTTLASNATLSPAAKQMAQAVSADSPDAEYEVASEQQIEGTYNTLVELAQDFDKHGANGGLSPREMFVKAAAMQSGLITLMQMPGQQISFPAKIIVQMANVTNAATFPELQAFIQEAQGNNNKTNVATFATMASKLMTDFSTVHYDQIILDREANGYSNTPSVRDRQVAYDYTFGEGGLFDVVAQNMSFVAEKADAFHTALRNVESPLSGMLFSNSKYLSAVKDLTVNSKTAFNDWIAISGNEEKIDGSSSTKSLFSANDQALVRNILTVAGSTKLKVVDSEPYVRPGILLGVYAAIALAFVSLTYIVMRRQDFR